MLATNTVPDAAAQARDAAAQHAATDDTPDLPTPLVESNDLLKGQKTVAIVHNGTVYRLQSTKMGKLILTK